MVIFVRFLDAYVKVVLSLTFLGDKQILLFARFFRLLAALASGMLMRCTDWWVDEESVRLERRRRCGQGLVLGSHHLGF